MESAAEQIQSKVEHQRLCDILSLVESLTDALPAYAEVSEHKEFNCSRTAISDLPGVVLNGEHPEEPFWLEVKRLAPYSPPKVRNNLEPWVILKDIPTDTPTLRPSIIVECLWEECREYSALSEEERQRKIDAREAAYGSTIQEERHLSDYPDVDIQFQEYLHNEWRIWAAQEEPRRRTIQLYGRLFEIQRRMEVEVGPKSIELAWGLGLTEGVIKGDGGAKRVNYPILTCRVFLTIEDKSHSIVVRPTSATPLLESQIYEECNIPGVPSLVSTYKRWLENEAAEINPFNVDSYIEVMRTAAAQLSEKGVYLPDYRGQGNVDISGEGLRVDDEWVLFARPKSNHFILDDIARLKKNIVETPELPEGPLAFVSEPADTPRSEVRRRYRGIWGEIASSFGEREDAQGKPEELYFPKPYNSEQLDIVDRLKIAPGVVVQGPPGTGKTHTIANIICHYLAHGNRVLVTSRGEAALRVLRDKLPDGIRDLAVTRLTNDVDGVKQQEKSLRKIAEEVDSASGEELKHLINLSERKIDELHHSLNASQRQMFEWSRTQSSAVPNDPEGRSPLDIAKLVYEVQDRYSWIPDRLGTDALYELTVTNEDSDCLRVALEKIGTDIQFIHDRFPKVNSLVTGTSLARLHEAYKELNQISQLSSDEQTYKIKSMTESVLSAANKLDGSVSYLIKVREKLLGGEAWTLKILTEFESKESGPIAKQLLQLLTEGKDLESKRLSRIASQVTIPEGLEGNGEATRLLAELSKGGTLPGWLARKLSSSTRASAELLEQIRIDGQEINSAEGWANALEEVALLGKARDCIRIWNNIGREFTAPSISEPRYDGSRKLILLLATVEECILFGSAAERSISDFFDEVFQPALKEGEGILSLSSLRKIKRSLDLGLPEYRRGALQQETKSLLDAFDGCTGSLIEGAKELVVSELGKDAIETSSLVAKWEGFFSTISRCISYEESFARVQQISGKFEKCGAPNLARQIRRGEELPEQFWKELPEAWQLRRWATYIDEVDCHKELRGLMAAREADEKFLANAYQDLIKYRTWLELKQRLTGRVRSNLQSYMNAIKSMGKGTGKRAHRYRSDAQRAMQGAWDAVPCWIMTTDRVSEILPSSIGLFDLVIIDEASQSSLEAIPAVIRGKKILVVGDDEQISPTSFVPEEQVNKQRRRHLSSLPPNFQAQLTPEKSLYDFARVVFPDGQVTLREHFRCVGEIIKFSNHLCYDGKIECLRVSTKSERLDPPLIDIYVPVGFREGKINRAEATVIVKEIEKITQTPSLQSRSIGVISMIGNEQAKYINDMLYSLLGEEVIRRHDLVCGDSLTFQGNERDIIFLSLISTPDDVASSSSRPMRQRFNVAASRARDRMYLVRSIKREDLKEGDLKTALLDHFKQIDLEEESRISNQRDLCESEFEIAVFDRLVQEGYRVIPQVNASRYRIDMVVEGDNNARLAVECDGDQFHGPEQWPEDYKRQRILERAGWKFWRCWGSSFYRDPEGCFADLMTTLRGLEIYPSSEGGYSKPSTLREYREVNPLVDYADTPVELSSESVSAESASIVEGVVSTGQEEVERSSELLSAREIGRVDLDEIIEYQLDDGSYEIRKCRVVELGETSLQKGLVAAKSALGRVLLGARVGDPFEVEIDGKLISAKITLIHDIVDEGSAAVAQPRQESLAENISLTPYNNWRPEGVPDPRTSKTSEILEGLLEIIEAEGPISCARALSLYSQAAGFKRLGSEIRDALFKALQSGITKGVIESKNELRTKDRLSNILRIPDKPDLLPRTAGGRDFGQIPPTELALALKLVIDAQGGGGDRSFIYRRVLQMYGLNRLALTTREHLAVAEGYLTV